MAALGVYAVEGWQSLTIDVGGILDVILKILQRAFAGSCSLTPEACSYQPLTTSFSQMQL